MCPPDGSHYTTATTPSNVAMKMLYIQIKDDDDAMMMMVTGG
jgi:hypothetical protein